MAASVCWGTTGTAQALGPDDASAIAFGSARNVIGALVLLAIAAARGRLVAGVREIERQPLLGAALTAAAFQLCFFGGVRLAGVAIGTVVGIGSGPIWGGALGWLVRGERPGRRWAVATTLALAGVSLLATTDSGGDPVDARGILLALGAGLGYASFALWSKHLTERHDPDLVMTWVFALSATLLLPLGIIAGIGPLLTASGIATVLWLGVVSLALAYLLFGRGIIGVRVATATTLSLAEPLTAAMLAIVLLDEELTPAAVAGIGLVLAGLVAIAMATPRQLSALPTRRRR
ncbi:MAG: EamA family transporter [Acidimicrobiales bacterium]